MKVRISFLIFCVAVIPSGFARVENEESNEDLDKRSGNSTLGVTNILAGRPDRKLFGIDVKVDMSTVPDTKPDDNYEEWQAPEFIQKGFPYYLSGFDKSGSPIWIAEFGKFDMHSIAHGPKQGQNDFWHFTRQACYVAVKSQKIVNPKLKQHIFIIDFEGLKLEQVSDPRTIQFTFGYARKYRRYFEKNISKMYVINVNPITEVVINLARPLFGRMLNRIESYGTNKEQWINRFLKVFPKDQLPEWYGGDANHRPVYILG